MRSSVAVSWTKTMLSYMPRVASKKRRMAAAPAMALLPADVSSSTCSVNALANASAVARPMISTQPLPGVALGVDMGSAQRDGAEIERHQQGLRHFVSRAVVGVDAAPGRHHDALHVAVVADVVGAGGPAEDVDRVIVAPHQAVRPEVRDLGPRVAGDVRREAHLQAAPRLAVLLPRRDLLAGEAGCGVQEGRGQIGPQRLAGEVGDMEGVPRRFQCLAGSSRASSTLPSSDSRVSRPGTNTLRCCGAPNGVMLTRSWWVSISMTLSVNMPACCFRCQMAPSIDTSALSLL